MQFLGPALNGKYAYGWIFSLFSIENLSGLNSDGFLYIWGSLCVRNGEIKMLVPAGIVSFPEKNKILQKNSFQNFAALLLTAHLQYFVLHWLKNLQ